MVDGNSQLDHLEHTDIQEEMVVMGGGGFHNSKSEREIDGITIILKVAVSRTDWLMWAEISLVRNVRRVEVTKNELIQLVDFYFYNF